VAGITKQTKDFIKKHEGLRLKKYKDFNGKYAVGYGDTLNVKDEISEQEAEELLDRRLSQGSEVINKHLKRDIPQNQYDVLLDLEYNLGATKLLNSGLIDVVNKGNIDEIKLAIGKYTKATNEKGQLVELPALVKRSQDRLKLWGGALTTDNTVDAFLDKYELPVVQGQSSVDSFLDSYKKEEVPSPEQQRVAGLNTSETLAGDKPELEFIKKAKQLAREERISQADAEAILFERDYGSAKVEARKETLAKKYPATSKWASKPENFEVLKSSPDNVMKIENVSKNLSPSYLDDLGTAVKSNIFIYQESFAHIANTLGIMDVDQTEKLLNEIDQEKQKAKFVTYQKGVDKINKAGQTLEETYGEGFNKIAEAWDSLFYNRNDQIDKLKNAYDGSEAALNSTLEFITTAFQNPKEFGLVGVQSAGTFVSPYIGALAGAAVGTPIGMTVAGASAGQLLGSGIIGYGSYLQEQLEEFRDPNTGKIDLKKAYSDPNRVAKWRSQATVYGISLALLDKLFMGKAGKEILKPVSGDLVKKIAGKTAQLAKGTVTQAVGEGVGETGATIAADLTGVPFGDKMTFEKVGRAVGKGFVEGAVSIVTGGMAEVGGAGVRKIISSTNKQAAAKTADSVKKTNEAVGSLETLAEVREIVENDPNLKENPDAVKELIEESVNPEPTDVEESDVFTEELDNDIKDEIKLIDNEKKGFVSITPSEWNKYHISKGIDPADAIMNLGPLAADQYNRNKTSDTSFSVPISDWAVGTLSSPPDINLIPRVNGNDLNAAEAIKTGQDIEKNPLVFFSQDELPPTPEQEVKDVSGTPITEQVIVEEDQDPEAPTLRPVKLYGKFRDALEKKAFDKIRNQLKGASKVTKNISPEAIDVVAELQFRHLRARAEMLNVPISKLADDLDFGKMIKAKSRGSFIPDQSLASPYAKVVLTKSADETTVLHELGHSWLHDMWADAPYINAIAEDQITEQQREYKEAQQILVDMIKERGFQIETMADLYNRKAEEVQAIHEMFAQTAEKYFYEGKYTDSRITKLLNVFRKYLTRALELVGTTYPQWPALEITPKIERIFTAILDASNKIDEVLPPMFSDPMFDPSFLGKDGQEYIDAILDSRSEAVGEVYAKSFNMSIRDRENAINAIIDQYYTDATDEANQRLSMRIKNNFDVLYNDFKNGSGDDPRISYESFAEAMAGGDVNKADQLKAMMPKNMINGKKKGGVDINDFMAAVGIADPAELFTLLKEAANIDKVIEDIVAQRIEKDMPVLKTDQEIHTIAEAAVQNKGKEKLMRREMQILQERFPTEYANLVRQGMLPASQLGTKAYKKAMLMQGYKIVMGLPFNAFSPRALLKDSDSFGRKAADAFRRKDVQGAMELKHQQAIHFQAYQVAESVKGEVAKARVLIKKKFAKYATSKDFSNKLDADTMLYGVEVINTLLNGSYNLPDFSTENFDDASAVNSDHVRLINDMVANVRALGADKNTKQMNVVELMAVGDLLETVLKVARKAKTLELNNKAIDREVLINQAIVEIGDRKANDPTLTAKQLDEMGIILSTLKGGRTYELKNMRTLLSSLFKTDIEFEQSVLGQLYNETLNAEAERNNALDEQRAKVENALKNAFKRKGMSYILGAAGNFLKAKDKRSQVINSPELKVSFNNVGELYSFLLHFLGSESGAEKILLGGINGSGPLVAFNDDFTEIDESNAWKFVNRLIEEGVLTKEDFDALQTVWDSFDSFYPKVKKAIRNTDGRKVNYIEGRGFTNKFGAYRGGYIPISKALDSLPQAARDQLLNPDANGYQVNDLFPHMYTGMASLRKKQYYDVNLDLGKITSKLAGVANVAYLREPMMNIGKFFSDENLNVVLENRRPDITTRAIVPWFNRTKLQEYVAPSDSFLDTFAKQIRSVAPLNFYVGNLKVVGMQFLGIPQALPVVGAKALTKGLAAYTTNRETKKFITDRSVRMKQRFSNHEKNMIKNTEELDLNFTLAKDAVNKGNKLAFIGISPAQRIVDQIVWLGAYSDAQTKKMTEKQAVAYADNAVEKTQGSSTVANMANIQFGSQSKKLFTMLTSNPLAINGIVYEKLKRSEGAWEKFQVVSSAAIFFALVPAIVQTMLGEIGAKGEEEDEDEKKQKQMDKIMLNMGLNAIDIVDPVFLRPLGGLAYNRFELSPGISNLGQSLLQTKEAAANLSNGVELNAREISGMLNAFTYITGLPLSVVGKGVSLNEFLTDEDLLEQRKAERRWRKRELKYLEREE